MNINFRSRMIAIAIILVVMALVAPGVIFAQDGEPVSDNGITPTVMASPGLDCGDLDYGGGFKYDANPTEDASHAIETELPLWIVTVGDPEPDETISIFVDDVNLNDDGEMTLFDWTSTRHIFAVIVTAQDANVYVYDNPGSLGDGGLGAPDGKGISHIEFCWDPSTYIDLSSFTTQTIAGEVTLLWETATEIDNAGFNLYRSRSGDGEFVKVNDLTIAALAEQGGGASYAFTDSVLPGTYYYKLEDFDLEGRRTQHGPITVTVVNPGVRALYLPSIQFHGFAQ